MFQEEELRVVTERLEVIKRDKNNNLQTTRELEMEKRSQRIDINKNDTSRADVEQSQEDRKKILDVDEKNLTEEDDKNAADIGEEGNLIWQMPFIYFRFLALSRIMVFSFTGFFCETREALGSEKYSSLIIFYLRPLSETDLPTLSKLI